MATPAVVVLVVGLAASALLVAGVVLITVQRAVRAYRDASRSLQRVQPLVEELADHQAVTRRELDRLAEQREHGHRARPGPTDRWARHEASGPPAPPSRPSTGGGRPSVH